MSDVGIRQVRASFKGDSRARNGERLCRVDRNIGLSVQRLEEFCFREIREHDKELVLLAGVVAFADRAVTRRLSEGWRRQIHVVMPVGSPRYWERGRVVSGLQDALGYLTGDAWTFEFTKRTEPLPRLQQPDLALGETKTVVVPFSNGLDSFAQAKLLPADGFPETPIRLTAKMRSVLGQADWVGAGKGARERRVSIPFTLRIPGAKDPTYRTRTFVFAAMAGLAAHLAGSRCVVVPEAGQGSFGPSLVPVGGESPHRGSHPGFTRRMSTFFEALWGETLKFEHPQVWRTKGQVLVRLKQLGLEAGWTKTHSCSQGPRQIHTARGSSLQCGLCSGCLLRRVAAHAAGLVEPDDQYYWPQLQAPTLKKMICADAGREPSDNDHDIGLHAVMAMEHLARLADRPNDKLMLKQNLYGAMDASALPEGEIKLRQLLTAHRDEWRSFTASLPSDAWINQQVALV